MSTSINALKHPQASSTAAASRHAARTRVAQFGATVWRTLEGVGRSRARRELLALADRWETDQPALAAQMRASCREQGNG